MVLLNLAFIPDEVVEKGLNHFKKGWHVDFKKAMDDYENKEQFVEWVAE
jgi:hypothetical protein